MEFYNLVTQHTHLPVHFYSTQGVLSLKLSHYEPRYILVLPLDASSHEQRLKSMGYMSSSQIDDTLKRAQLYQQTNQDKPGFFDMVVDSSKYTFPHSPNQSMHEIVFAVSQNVTWAT